MGITDEFEEYKGGIFYDKTGYIEYDHIVSLVGWGFANNTKYWVVRNSWGANWGENGFFRIVRGINNLGIEQNCSFAVPVDTWTNPKKHYTTDEERKDPRNNYTNSNYRASDPKGEGFLKPSIRGRVKVATFTNGPRIEGPLPWERGI